jgi:riboflavin transporter FmnP
MLKNNRKIISVSASLAAFSAVTQLIHIGYLSPTWGMWIDIVSVSWIIAYFLYGFKSSLLVSVIGAIVITLFAPDTWLGASMKWIATFPIYTSLFIFEKLVLKNKALRYQKFFNIIIPTFTGIIFRSLIVLPLNYYYAIPIWTKMTPQQALTAIPWYIIVIFNSLQAIVDVIFAWILTYRFKLHRFSNI